MSRKKHHEEEEHVNHERWLVTYADMLTLLMVLFIVLFAISNVDQKKFNAFGSGLRVALGANTAPIVGSSGVLSGGTSPTGDAGHNNANGQLTLPALPQIVPHVAASGKTEARLRAAATKNTLAAAKRRIQAALKKQGLSKDVQFQQDSLGLTVHVLTDDVLFASGDDQLESTGGRILDAIAPALAMLPNQVSVQGNTDDLPIHSSRFESNWELSALRATAVLHDLVAHGVASSRISATGFADEKPLVPNTSAANRARNRRVDVVVLAGVSGSSSASPTNGK